MHTFSSFSAACKGVPFQLKIRNKIKIKIKIRNKIKIKIKIKGNGQECPLYTNCLFRHQLCNH